LRDPLLAGASSEHAEDDTTNGNFFAARIHTDDTDYARIANLLNWQSSGPVEVRACRVVAS
jgi:hypothetical protein